MSLCKDCVHYEVCKDDVELHRDFYDCLEVDGVEKHCDHFKPKSRFVELPCAFGDVIYMLVTRKTTSYDFKRENGTLKMIKQRNQHIFIKRTSFMKSNFFKVLEWWGKTVFPSRELAEEALKERERK